jgi:hypothetical protein
MREDGFSFSDLRVFLCVASLVAAVGLFFVGEREPVIDVVSPHTIDFATLRTTSSATGPALIGFWEVPPDIKICSNVRVSKTRVEAALRFWSRLGYDFGRVYVDEGWKTNPRGCEALPGEIAFRVPPQDLSFIDDDGTTFMAITRTYRIDGAPNILAADIFVQHEANYSLERIVEHELGHALGWLHHSSSYHIMHPLYVKTGHRVAGVHRNDYTVFSALLLTE